MVKKRNFKLILVIGILVVLFYYNDITIPDTNLYEIKQYRAELSNEIGSVAANKLHDDLIYKIQSDDDSKKSASRHNVIIKTTDNEDFLDQTNIEPEVIIDEFNIVSDTLSMNEIYNLLKQDTVLEMYEDEKMQILPVYTDHPIKLYTSYTNNGYAIKYKRNYREDVEPTERKDITQKGDIKNPSITPKLIDVVHFTGFNQGPTSLQGSNVKVCIIDTGVTDSEFFFNKPLVNEYDFVNNDNDTSDDNGHGTHVAGIVAMKPIRGCFAWGWCGDLVGVAPNVDLMAAKVLDKSGEGYLSDVLAGMVWCVENGADIVSMSIGSEKTFKSTCDNTLGSMILNSLTKQNDVIFTVAIGNDGRKGGSSPGCASGAVSVGSVGWDRKSSSFSGINNEVDIVAPGEGIISAATTDGTFVIMSGTSMSTPILAGAFAVFKSVFPSLSTSTLKQAIYDGAIDPFTRRPKKNIYGNGVLNGYSSCKVLHNNPVSNCPSYQFTVNEDKYHPMEVFLFDPGFILNKARKQVYKKSYIRLFVAGKMRTFKASGSKSAGFYSTTNPPLGYSKKDSYLTSYNCNNANDLTGCNFRSEYTDSVNELFFYTESGFPVHITGKIKRQTITTAEASLIGDCGQDDSVCIEDDIFFSKTDNREKSQWARYCKRNFCVYENYDDETRVTVLVDERKDCLQESYNAIRPCLYKPQLKSSEVKMIKGKIREICENNLDPYEDGSLYYLDPYSTIFGEQICNKVLGVGAVSNIQLELWYNPTPYTFYGEGYWYLLGMPEGRRAQALIYKEVPDNPALDYYEYNMLNGYFNVDAIIDDLPNKGCKFDHVCDSIFVR